MNEVVEIRTPEDIGKFMQLCNLQKKAVDAKLMNDIDISNYFYTTPYVLKGTFDGQGYTIKGAQKMLFYNVEKTGIIKNLTVEGNLLPRSALCVFNSGTIENCVNKGDVVEGDGFCENLRATGKLINCRNEGKIKGRVDYTDFVSLGFNAEKRQLVTWIEKGAIYENNTAAGSFKTLSGCAIPVEILVNSIPNFECRLTEDKIRKVLELETPHTDERGRTWLHQFIEETKKENNLSTQIDRQKEYVSKIIKNIALHTNINFNAKDNDGKTAVDYIYKKDGKILQEEMYAKKLISNIAKEQRKNRIADTQEINDWGIER